MVLCREDTGSTVLSTHVKARNIQDLRPAWTLADISGNGKITYALKGVEKEDSHYRERSLGPSRGRRKLIKEELSLYCSSGRGQRFRTGRESGPKLN